MECYLFHSFIGRLIVKSEFLLTSNGIIKLSIELIKVWPCKAVDFNLLSNSAISNPYQKFKIKYLHGRVAPKDASLSAQVAPLAAFANENESKNSLSASFKTEKELEKEGVVDCFIF